MEMSKKALFMFGSSKQALVLLAVFLSAIALRVYCFHGFVGLDDAEYAKLSHAMAHGAFTVGSYSGPPVFPLRLGIIFPTSMLVRFFGVSEWSILVYPFVLSVCFIILAYAATRHFFGDRAGLIAAAIWAILPLDLINATKLLPDLAGAFYACLAVVLILLLSRSKIKQQWMFLAGGLAGLSFGLSWLCKETVLYLVPFCVVLSIIQVKAEPKKNTFLWAGVAVGSMGIFLSEMVVYRNITQDWLYRFHEMERNYRECAIGFFTEGSTFGWSSGENYIKALVKRLFLRGPETIFLNEHFLFMPLFGTVALTHALYWKNRSFLIPSFWLMSLIVMFNFSSSSMSSYLPLALLNRYLYPICLPAIVLTAGFVDKLIGSGNQNRRCGPVRERFFWGILLALIVGVIGGYSTFSNIRNMKETTKWTIEVRELSKVIQPQENIYTDPISQKGLEFFWRYPAETHIVNFEDVRSQQIPAKSLVLVNRSYADWLHTNAGMWLTRVSDYKNIEVYRKTLPSWKTVWRNGNATLYRVE